MTLITDSRIINTFWSFFEKVGAQAVSFGVSVVLARLISPAAYGSLALCTVFVSFLQIFATNGLGIALVQKKDVDDIDYSTVFIFNIVTCVVLYVLLFLFAPFVASYYGDSSLTPVIRVLGISILCSGVRNVQESIAMKSFLFKTFFFATITGTIVSGAIGLFMAFKGYGIWALVAQSISSSIINLLMLSFAINFKPSQGFSFKRLKGLFKYGWKMFACSVLDNVNSDIRQLIIGKKYTSKDLAFYNRGFSLVRMITGNVDASIGSILFPTLANEQDDLLRVKSITEKVISLVCYVMVPLLLGFSACSSNFISLVFGEKWIAVVPFLQVFCLRYCLFPLHSVNLNVIKSIGRSDLYLKNAVAISVIEIIFLLITMKYGVLAIAIGQVLSMFFDILICIYPSKKLLNFGYKEQFRDVLPPIVMGAVMWICVSFVSQLFKQIWLALIAQVVTGIMVYLVLSLITRNKNLLYLIQLMKKRSISQEK